MKTITLFFVACMITSCTSSIIEKPIAQKERAEKGTIIGKIH